MLAAMKKDLHDRLWKAQERWFRLRALGETKRALKLRGLDEAGDPNRFTRNLIFAGSTRRSYEETLRTFLEFAHQRFDIRRLEDLGKLEAKAFIEDGIARGLAASTLEARLSHLSKLGSLIGKSSSLSALSRKYSRQIRQWAKTGQLPGPRRTTPSSDVARRAVEILRQWDERHFERTGHPRAYHLAARLQIETAARSISATERITRESLLGGDRVLLVGKSGKKLVASVTPELYVAIRDHLAPSSGPLAGRRGYQAAWARAIRQAGGRATGTHGLRRLAARSIYSSEYRRLLGPGTGPHEARLAARQEAVERLGHGRNRGDQASCYLGPPA